MVRVRDNDRDGGGCALPTDGQRQRGAQLAQSLVRVRARVRDRVGVRERLRARARVGVRFSVRVRVRVRVRQLAQGLKLEWLQRYPGGQATLEPGPALKPRLADAELAFALTGLTPSHAEPCEDLLLGAERHVQPGSLYRAALLLSRTQAELGEDPPRLIRKSSKYTTLLLSTLSNGHRSTHTYYDLLWPW